MDDASTAAGKPSPVSPAAAAATSAAVAGGRSSLRSVDETTRLAASSSSSSAHSSSSASASGGGAGGGGPSAGAGGGDGEDGKGDKPGIRMVNIGPKVSTTNAPAIPLSQATSSSQAVLQPQSRSYDPQASQPSSSQAPTQPPPQPLRQQRLPLSQLQSLRPPSISSLRPVRQLNPLKFVLPQIQKIPAMIPNFRSTTSNNPTNAPPLPRKQNMVLPSYEAELLPDNTVSRESPPKRILQRLMSYANHLFFPWTAQPRGRIERAIGRLMRTPYDIQTVAVIGVHGWFPGRLLQRVVGEPTGTSQRFAEKMAQATRRFFLRRYGINLRNDAITLMPLEGEGKVEERVERLYMQLMRADRGWVERLRAADLVLVSAHSQGTPVSVMLMARLIKEGIVDPGRQRACILAMAGISHGPFPPLRSNLIVKYFEADAARELFEFNDWETPIARKYQLAMAEILAAATKVVAVGSWYDQVVPLYSATMHGFSHPSIYRAIYIEGVDYTPDFLSHLVVYALRLRNAGISDRGLIVYLSELLEGNLYGFGTQGHSTLYEELNTYTLAVAWAMGNYVPPPLPFPEENFSRGLYSHAVNGTAANKPRRDSSDTPSLSLAPNNTSRPSSSSSTSSVRSKPPPPSSSTLSDMDKIRAILNPIGLTGVIPRTSSSVATAAATSNTQSNSLNAIGASITPSTSQGTATTITSAPTTTGQQPLQNLAVAQSSPPSQQQQQQSTTTVASGPLQAPSRLNPYYLPWIMARICSDRNVLADETLVAHLEELTRMFDGWDPSARALRELQYRLDPFRAKL